MTPNRLFLSAEALEAWVAADRVRIAADRLTDTASGQVFELREGVRFLAEVSGAADGYHLVGTVKDTEQLAALGGEHMADSVLVGDNAYRVQPGFVGRPMRLHDHGRAADTVNPVAVAPTERPPAPPLEALGERPARQTIMSLQNFFLHNVK